MIRPFDYRIDDSIDRPFGDARNALTLDEDIPVLKVPPGHWDAIRERDILLQKIIIAIEYFNKILESKNNYREKNILAKEALDKINNVKGE